MTHLRIVPRPSPLDMTSDEACLGAFQQELDYIHRSLRRLGVASPDVEDLAHEAFIVLRRKWAGYDSSRSLRAYLFGIIFRIAAAHQRKRRRDGGPIGLRVEGHDPCQPELALQSKQVRALVVAALDRIPLPRRAVLVMHDLDDVPMEDVAATLAIPRFTAYSRLRKARKELEVVVRRLLKGEHP